MRLDRPRIRVISSKNIYLKSYCTSKPSRYRLEHYESVIRLFRIVLVDGDSIHVSGVDWLNYLELVKFDW